MSTSSGIVGRRSWSLTKERKREKKNNEKLSLRPFDVWFAFFLLKIITITFWSSVTENGCVHMGVWVCKKRHPSRALHILDTYWVCVCVWADELVRCRCPIPTGNDMHGNFCAIVSAFVRYHNSLIASEYFRSELCGIFQSHFHLGQWARTAFNFGCMFTAQLSVPQKSNIHTTTF